MPINSGGSSPTACELCRKRKVKCDRILPTCSQCAKDSRNIAVCLYRVTCLDLAHRSETGRAKSRFVASKNRFSSKRMMQTQNEQAMSIVSCSASHKKTASIPLSIGVTDTALAVGRNILLAGFSHGVYYQYLPGLWMNSPIFSGLAPSIESIGLIILSIIRNDSQLMLKAKEQHATALSITSQQISAYVYTRSSYALAATILLLALFAVMQYNNSEALEIWYKHINGALAVLCTDNANTSQSSLVAAELELVRHIINCVHLSYLQQRKCIPAEVKQFYTRHACPEIHFKLHQVINGINDVRRSFELSLDVRALIMQELDSELMALSTLLKGLKPFRLGTLPNRSTKEPIIHIYDSHRACQYWNLMRVLRLELDSVRLEYLVRDGRADSRSTSAIQSQPAYTQQKKYYILTSIAAAAFDICASIPLFLRPTVFSTKETKERALRQPDVTHWGHSLIWPLAIAQTTPGVPRKLLSFIEEVLPILWSVAGYPHDTLPEKQHIKGLHVRDWAHVFFWC